MVHGALRLCYSHKKSMDFVFNVERRGDEGISCPGLGRREGEGGVNQAVRGWAQKARNMGGG